MATLAVVLVIPAVLFLVSTVAQFVVYYHASHLAAAAQESARAAQMADGSEIAARAQGQDFIAQAGPNLVLEPQVLVTRDMVAEIVSVEVRGFAPQLIPGVSIAISARAGGPLERFEAQNEGFSISEGSAGSNSRVGGS